MVNIKDYEVMAKLDLCENERNEISDLADKLIKSFDAFSKINTEGIEPMFTVLDINNVLREDISVKMISRDELLINAPMQQDGYFQVPKTL